MRNGKRLIAYYLPAFYPIPENDKFWGEGFTEWDNVESAEKIYDDHTLRCFPHEDVGYYEMSLETLRKQQAMAKQYGLDGWAIYQYWFMGNEPFPRTLDLIMKNKDLDLPFCLMWANEDWSRTWDGVPTDILIKQEYSEQDFLDFIWRMIPVMSDERYIKVDGKPLLKVFGASEQFVSVQDVWRKECVKAGLPEPFLIHKTILDQGERFYEDVKVIEGWDGAFEFPPRGLVCDFLNDFYTDGWHLMDYRCAMAASVLRNTDKRLFRTVFPSWDNSPRKGKNGPILYHNSTPDMFAYWLDMMTTTTTEDIVFINAWNEWGESAVLEPSTELGYSNLKALQTENYEATDLREFYATVLGVSCHWRGDACYHAGDVAKAVRLWKEGERFGNLQCLRNLVPK